MSEQTSINTAPLKRELDRCVSQRRKLANTPSEVVEEEMPKLLNEDCKLKTRKNVNNGITREEDHIRGFNVPENILIVFDRVKDEVESDFFDCGDKRITPRNVMLRVLRIFIHNKLAYNDKHSFAIMALDETECTWHTPKFIKNPQILDRTLHKLAEPCDTEDIFNMNDVFEKILEKHGTLIHYSKSPPNSVYRVIFCYGRSFTLPLLELSPKIGALLEAPNFFFDAVFTHEPLTTPSKHDDVFKLLRIYDRKNAGYLFSIERNLKGAHMAMAHLLAHPLQRSPLKTASACLSTKGNAKPQISKDDEEENV